MRKQTYVFLMGAFLIPFFCAPQARGQVQAGAWSANLQGSGSFQDAGKLQLSLSPQAFYHPTRHLALGLGLPFGFSMEYSRTGGLRLPQGDLGIQPEARWYFRDGKKAQPYLFASTRINWGKFEGLIPSPNGGQEPTDFSYTNAIWRSGAGIALWLSPSVGLDVSLGYRRPSFLRFNGPAYLGPGINSADLQVGLIMLLKRPANP